MALRTFAALMLYCLLSTAVNADQKLFGASGSFSSDDFAGSGVHIPAGTTLKFVSIQCQVDATDTSMKAFFSFDKVSKLIYMPFSAGLPFATGFGNSRRVFTSTLVTDLYVPADDQAFFSGFAGNGPKGENFKYQCEYTFAGITKA